MVSLSEQLAESIETGAGLYSLSDAAFYARIPRQTLSAWFFGKKGSQYRSAKLASHEEKFLTFNEFIEAIAIRSLRVEHGFSLKEIIDALEFAEEQYGVKNLFTHPDHRVAVDRSKNLHLIFNKEADPIQVSSRKARGQQAFKPILQEYLKFIQFDDKMRAIAYRPAKYFGYSIAMLPTVSFGDPIIEEVSYPVRVLANAAKAENSAKRAAELFEVDDKAVQAAVKFMEEWSKAVKIKAA